MHAHSNTHSHTHNKTHYQITHIPNAYNTHIKRHGYSTHTIEHMIVLQHFKTHTISMHTQPPTKYITILQHTPLEGHTEDVYVSIQTKVNLSELEFF
jgi:hypothetical protein